MKGDTRKYLSRAFDKASQSQREEAAREVNEFMERERWFDKLLSMEWKIVPTPWKDLSRLEISGIEK